MADFELSLRLSADGQTFVGTMRAARSEVDRLAGTMDKGGREAQDLARETSRTERAMQGLSGAARLLGAALAALGVGLSLRSIAGAADTATRLRAQLGTVTESSEELGETWSRLQAISDRSFTALDANVTLYARLARSTRDLGVNQEQLFAVTQALTDALRVSGAGAQEAQAAMIQLSQGLASGTLRGDEFNSVAEQAPVVLDLLSRELGVTRGALREMAADGEITADVVVNALLAGAEDLREEAEKMGPTLAGSWEIAKNSTLDIIGTFDDATGASNALASSLARAAQSLRDLFTPVRGERDRLERTLRGLQDRLDAINNNGRIPETNALFDDSRRSLEAQIRATKEAIGLLDKFAQQKAEAPLQPPVIVEGDKPKTGRKRDRGDPFLDSMADHRREVEAEARELERLRRERERVADSQQEIIDNLEEEILLFGKSRGEVEAYRLGLRGGTPEQQALARSLGDTVDQLEAQRDAMEESKRASEAFGRTLQNAFEDAIVRGGDLKDVLSGLAAELSSLLLDNAFNGLRGGSKSGGGLLGGLFSSLGGLFGGGGGGGGFLGGSAGASIFDDPVDSFTLSFHQGGVVGAGGGRGRFVSAMAFADAPRMHAGGLAGDEVPAILRRGEEVLRRDDPRHVGNGSGGGGVTVSQTITIDARGADQGVEQRLRVALERTKRETLALIRSEIVRGGPMRGLVRS